MGEVVGLAVGKRTTTNPWICKSQAARSGRFTRIHFGPSFGPTTRLSELPRRSAQSLHGETLVRVAVLYTEPLAPLHKSLKEER
jgi:hypothetical protein